MLAGDIALIGGHQPFAIGLLRDRRDGGIAINGSAALARTLGQRLRQISGLDIAVVGVLDGANHAVHIGERPDVLHLIAGDRKLTSTPIVRATPA